MARPSRTVIREDDPTYLWKFVLRLLSIIVAIVGIGTTAWVLTSSTAPAASTLKPDAEAPKYGYEVDSSTFLPWQFIALGLSAIWNIVNIVTLLARNRALHPGANVACDLLLWLGLFFTGAIAFLGSANYYTNYVRGDYSYYDYGPYGGGTYSNGTSYQYTATGTRIPGPADTQCGGFTTCEAQQQYFSSLRKKGVIVAVGASMAFVLLLFHFALFISACRYTHARNHVSADSRRARAITDQATEIARRMVAEMTGPNGGFIPLNQIQTSEGSRPIEHRQVEEGLRGEAGMQRRNPAQPGYDYQQVRRQEDGDDPSRAEMVRQPRFEQTSPGPVAGESSSAAVRRGKQRAVDGPRDETHPALRGDPDLISLA